MRNHSLSRSVLSPAPRTRGGLFLILAALLALACQSKSPEEKLLKSVQPVGSWLASLEMTGQKWNANSVPASFVRNTTAAFLEEIDKAAEETSKSDARPALRDPLRGLLAEARDAGTGLRRGADAGDRAAVVRETGRLTALHDRFEALVKAQGGSE
jgi:hypothetical protein